MLQYVLCGMAVGDYITVVQYHVSSPPKKRSDYKATPVHENYKHRQLHITIHATVFVQEFRLYTLRQTTHLPHNCNHQNQMLCAPNDLW